MRSTGYEAPQCVFFSSFVLLTNCINLNKLSSVELKVTCERSVNIECGINKEMLEEAAVQHKQAYTWPSFVPVA